MEPGPQRLVLQLGLACGLILTAAYCESGRGSEREPTPGAAKVRVADRDGDALVLLDAALIEVGRVALRRPVRLERAPRGNLWAALAVEDSPLGAHELVLLDGAGRVLARRSGGALLDLDGGERALVVEAEDGGATAARWVDAAGADEDLACVTDLVAAAVLEKDVLLARGTGELMLLREGIAGAHERIAQVPLGAALLDVAPAPGGWWILARDPHTQESVLARLDAALGHLWSVPTGSAARRILAAAGQERAWLSDPERGRALRFGRGGVLEVRVQLALAGALAGEALEDGGVLLAAPGALLRLDRLGAALPGQGGFAYLSDVEL